jgi:hypothetical protein
MVYLTRTTCGVWQYTNQQGQHPQQQIITVQGVHFKGPVGFTGSGRSHPSIPGEVPQPVCGTTFRCKEFIRKGLTGVGISYCALSG